MPITLEYLRQLGACWTDAQLEAAAASWPPPSSRTWDWWLGDRLAGLPRADVLLRVHVAVAHGVAMQLVVPPQGAVVRFAKKCSDEQLRRLLNAYGPLLDDPTNRNAIDALLAVLREPLPAPEVAPPTE